MSNDIKTNAEPAAADNWLLPDGVEEILPPHAARLEKLRRQILDLYQCWGYDLVFPPLIEYLESLQIGAGKDLDLQTFKLTDHLSGRSLGIRPDITPQVARIVHRYYDNNLPQRLCYAGSILHSRPRNLTANRNLIQIGLELCGSSTLSADIEVLKLMIDTLAIAGCQELTLDLGHVGIFKGLMDQAQLNEDDESTLIDIYHRKAVAELDAFLAERVSSSAHRSNLRVLETLAGGEAVLSLAETELIDPPQSVLESIQQLKQVAENIRAQYQQVKLYFDLSEIHGYNYHTGIVFSAYVNGTGDAIASGGRYDCIGESLGKAQVATGFSTDLRQLSLLNDDSTDQSTKPSGIFAPNVIDAKLTETVNALRSQGERVVSGLSADCSAEQYGCSKVLIQQNNEWIVKDFKI